MLQAEFQSQALVFLKHLFADIALRGIQIPKHWDVDHLCYRVDSLVRYEDLKKDFAKFAKLMVESEVNGRPIATFKLSSAIVFEHHRIDVVELPAPKPSKPTKEGFEHIEIVCDAPMAELLKRYQDFPLDQGGLKKDFNAELEIDLGERNLKFHHLSLESVVNLETHPEVFKALNASQILKTFKKYDPLVAGTFPLKLDVAGSDLDVLMSASDLDSLTLELKASFGDFQFQSKRSSVDQLDTLVANFVFDGIPFEVFAQDKPSVQQKAYRHFQMEEKILKKMGKEFHEQVLSLRKQGVKTEPAFASALALAGDPYEAVLNYKI